MNIDWKRKLTSRKFWMSIAGFITGVVLLVQGQETITGVIMSLGSVVAYVIGEGLTDLSNKKD